MTSRAELAEVAENRIATDWGLDEWADRLVEQAGVGVTIVDRHGTVMYYNKRASEHLDRMPEYIDNDVRKRHRRAVTNPRFDAMLELSEDGRVEPVRPYGKTTILVSEPLAADGHGEGQAWRP